MAPSQTISMSKLLVVASLAIVWAAMVVALPLTGTSEDVLFSDPSEDTTAETGDTATGAPSSTGPNAGNNITTRSAQGDLCGTVGHAYSRVYLLKDAVCATRDNYVKENEDLSGGFFQGIAPGPNTEPCHLFVDPQTGEEQPGHVIWRVQLGYNAAICNNLVSSYYISDMAKYERIRNSSANNPFPFILESIAQQCSESSKTVNSMIDLLPNVTVPSHDRLPRCPGMGDGDAAAYHGSWPPAEELTESKEEYQYYLSEYNFGTLNAVCETLSDMHDAIFWALNAVCPSERHAQLTATQSTTKEKEEASK